MNFKHEGLVTHLCITLLLCLLLSFHHCFAQNCSNGDLTMLAIPSCASSNNFNSSTSSPLNIDNGQTACTNVANATFNFNQVNMTPNNNGGSTLIINNNNNVTINTLTIQNNNNNANITVYVAAGATLTILNSINTPSNVRFINYGTLNFGANPGGMVTLTVQNNNNLFQNAVGATMRFNSTLNFASGNNSRFINNGTVTANTMTINTNGVRYIQGNNASTTIGTLSQNNQTDVLCVPNNMCAKFTVTTAIPQLNNQLTSSNGSNSANDRGQQIVCYQGSAANYRGGSVSYPTGVGSAFSTNCATNCVSILPVELLYFVAKRTENAILLTWATASEKNNHLFEIERSINGMDFSTIAKVQSKKGNSDQVEKYEFIDVSARSSAMYYRLRQIDIDGSVSFFKIIRIDGEYEADQMSFTFFPNPAQDRLAIQFPNWVEKAEIQVFNLQGLTFLTQKIEFARGIVLELDSLKNGVYFLKISTHTSTKVSKFLINRD